MSIPLPSVKPPNTRWEYKHISPGYVGVVGDANVQVRLKQSNPYMKMRFDRDFSGARLPRMGANISDGTHVNYFNGGGPARVLNSNWGSGRRFETSHGSIHQDLRPTDRRAMERVDATPSYQWRTDVAQVYNVKRGGDKFLPLPGPYGLAPGDLPRGGAFPIVQSIEDGEGPGVEETTGIGRESYMRHEKVGYTPMRTTDRGRRMR